MLNVMKTIKSALTNESGQGLAEYGLILGLVAILCIGAVVGMSGNIKGLLASVGTSI